MLESDYENINIEANRYQRIQWLSEKDLKDSPISTAMKKVLKLDNVDNSKVNKYACHRSDIFELN